jgi:penicillin-binding protein-related factor A (putative recombinase)
MSAFNAYEQQFNDYHRLELLPRGLAEIHKIPDPVNILADLGRGLVRGQRTKKTWIDFGGYLLDGSGRAVWIEVKETKKDKLTPSLFSSHQISFLQRADQAGCLAFAGVYASSFGQHFVVPARVLHLLPLSWSQLAQVGCARPSVRWFELMGVVL